MPPANPCRQPFRLLLLAWLGSLAAVAAMAGAEDRPVAPAAAEPALRPEDTPAVEEPEPAETAKPEPPASPAEEKAAAPEAPPVKDWFEAQVELSRRGFSCGSIDGVRGSQTVAALKAFQQNEGLRETGTLDKATRDILRLSAPAVADHVFTAEDLARLRPIPDTWLGKSQMDALYYANAIELAAEQHHASPNLIRKLNPGVDWAHLLPGVTIKAPAVGRFTTEAKAVKIHISLGGHVLEALDNTGRIIVHFPVSIARNVEKRPVGELHVAVVIPDPVYTWDPAVFTESPESREITHKLILPPGPNNPVGVAWIGLDLTGYGIHGTPEPENVGRTESHGCFRLANWDAQVLLDLAWVGMPVEVDP